MKHRFPLLYELGRAAHVSTNVGNALDSDQSATQDELRAEMIASRCPIGQTGMIFPWYREARSMTATEPSEGGSTVGNQVLDIGAGLRERLVLEALGARVFGGLRENVRFGLPNTLISADWKSENADAPDGSYTFRGIDLSPKRVTAYLDVSWQLLIQGPASENHIRTELMAALAEEIQRKAIAGSGANNQPLGIINTPGIGSVVGGTNGAAPDYDDITELEYLVGHSHEGEKTGWLISSLGRRKLRRTAMFASGSQPIWPVDQARALLGHPAGVTDSVPDTLTKGSANASCSAIIHGEFTELLIGLWGPGVSVSVTPVGGHLNGKTRFVATAYVDSGVRAPEAFAAMKDALCAA